MKFVYRQKPTFGEQLGASLGAGISSGLSEGTQRLMQSKENKAIKEQFGVDLSNIRDPQARSMLLQRAQLMKQAQANIPATTQFTKPSTSGLARAEPELEDQIIKPEKFALKGEKLAFGEFEKPIQVEKLSPGEKQLKLGTQERIYLPEEINYLAKQSADEKQALGMLTSYEQERELIEKQQRKVLNQKNIERAAVDEGMKYLGEIYKGITIDDEIGLANEFVDLNLQNLPEVERLKAIKSLVRDYANNIAAVERGLPKKTWWTQKRESLSPEVAKEELGRRLKFLTDRGMYDKAREIASTAGYYPEEIESVWGTLGGKTQSILDSIPDKKAPPPWKYSSQEDFSKETQLANQLLPKILRDDPRVNLVMLRKEFESKGVPSNVFYEALMNAHNELAQETGYDFDRDQKKQAEKLVEPPIQGLIDILRDPNISFRRAMFGSHKSKR